jgi:Fe-S-cluster-containing dehydrogenase component
MPRYAMVIDLNSCVGCGACDIACKNENNVPEEMHWANHMVVTTGTFPNVRYQHIPTLCNHCESPSCVRACPTKAMHQDENGIVKHDPNKCIGCLACQLADPYKVIYFNREQAHSRWQNRDPLISKGSYSPREVALAMGEPIPYYNPDRARSGDGVRRKGIVEKCSFCDHRVREGEMPWCTVACPANCRHFGDLDDPKSNVSLLLAKYPSRVLARERGTRPKVFYLRDY